MRAGEREALRSGRSLERVEEEFRQCLGNNLHDEVQCRSAESRPTDTYIYVSRGRIQRKHLHVCLIVLFSNKNTVHLPVIYSTIVCEGLNCRLSGVASIHQVVTAFSVLLNDNK